MKKLSLFLALVLIFGLLTAIPANAEKIIVVETAPFPNMLSATI